MRSENAMRKYVLIPLAIAGRSRASHSSLRPAVRSRFQGRLGGRGKREQGSRRAHAINGPRPQQQLAAAKKAAAAGDFDKASSLAKEAEALAKASIFSGQGAAGSLESGGNSLSGPASGRAFA